MAPITSLPNAAFTKLLYVGDSGSGKTGSLVSLVKAGYRLRILDFDNGFEILRNLVAVECPDKMQNIDIQSFRDTYKAGPSGPVCQRPTAFVNGVKALDKWDDGSTPSEWGPETIFVLDSLTAMGAAALEWGKGLLSTTKLAQEKRQWYQEGQSAIEHVLATLTGAEFHSHVIVMSHIDIREDASGAQKGYASSIGAALGPKLPRYFNTWIAAERIGTGSNVKRKIKTLPTPLLDLKTPAPGKLDAEYPLETGLASIFRALKP